MHKRAERAQDGWFIEVQWPMALVLRKYGKCGVCIEDEVALLTVALSMLMFTSRIVRMKQRFTPCGSQRQITARGQHLRGRWWAR